MTKNPFEVPSEMRDLAARSVEQARKAFETFIGAAQKASDQASGGPLPIQKSLAETSKMTVGFAERNMNAAFDMAQRMVQAKTVEEVMAIQSEFMQAQAQALQGQMQEAGVKAKKQFDDAAAGARQTFDAASDAMPKPAPKAPAKKAPPKK